MLQNLINILLQNCANKIRTELRRKQSLVTLILSKWRMFILFYPFLLKNPPQKNAKNLTEKSLYDPE